MYRIWLFRLLLFLFGSLVQAQNTDTLNTKKTSSYNSETDYNLELSLLYSKLEFAKNAKKIDSVVSILHKIGTIYTLVSNYPKAQEIYLNVLKIAEQTKNKNEIAAAKGNLGKIYFSLQNYEKALEHYFNAFNLYTELKNQQKAAVYLGNIGNIYWNREEYNAALEYHLKALTIALELKNDDEIAREYTNIGAIYGELAGRRNNYSASETDSLYKITLDYYFKTLAIEPKTIAARKTRAVALGNIGSVYTEQKKYKDAEKYLLEAVIEFENIGSRDYLSYFQKNLSDLYEQTNQVKKAFEYYKKHAELEDSLYNLQNTQTIIKAEMNFEFEKQQAIAKAEQEKQNAIALKEKQRQKLILIFVSCFLLLIAVFAAFMYNRWRITQKQKSIIEKQKEKIVDSINYAQFIQESILIDETEIQKHIPGSFIFLQPKDIVSGDFYWFSKIVGSRKSEAGSQESGVQSSEFGVKVNESINSGLRTSDFQPKNNSELPANTKNYELPTSNSELLIIAAADCTGHGVPGAFMSMIGNTLLNQIVNEKRITQPSEILYHLNLGIYEALHQKKGQKMSRDGMDIALCCIDFKNKELQYAGAQNPLCILKNNELSIVNSTKESIGGGLTFRPKNPLETKFTNHVIPIEPGMGIYIFSDGFKDQFGADNKQKFGSQQFKDLILKSHPLEPSGQKELFATTLHNWQGNTPQTDDILVIGIKF